MLQRGSGFSEGKYRIYFYFQESHTKEETAAFLKKEYGTGGGTFGYPDGTRGGWSYDGKGIHLEKTGSHTKPDLVLRWNKAAARLKELIEADRYLDAKEKAEIPLYLDRVAARELQAEKQTFIDAVKDLPPAEKRDSLPQRLTDFITYLDGYERDILDEYDLPELKENSLETVRDYLQSPEKVTQLYGFLGAVKGRTSDVFSRANAWRFGLELKELYPWRYEYHLGDTVYLGAETYEILAFDENTVRLYDTQFPLFNKEFPREEFDRRVAENPSNEHLLEICAYQPLSPLERANVETQAPRPAEPEPSEGGPKYDLMYGHLGNGITVSNRLEEEHGDYKTVAHISPERQVTYYDNALPPALRVEIERFARTSDMRISASQDAPVFYTPPETTLEIDKEEPRFTVAMTSDAFPDPEDAFAIWDNQYEEYYAREDGRILTYPTEEEAEAGLAAVIRAEQGSRVDEMLAQAEQIAAESAVEPDTRFTLIDSDGDFADPYVVWDDLHDGYYVAEDSITPTFLSRWEGEAYVERLNKETAEAAPAGIRCPRPFYHLFRGWNRQFGICPDGNHGGRCFLHLPRPAGAGAGVHAAGGI